MTADRVTVQWPSTRGDDDAGMRTSARPSVAAYLLKRAGLAADVSEASFE